MPSLGASPTCLGILAGGGSVPGEIAAAAASRGWPVHVVAIEGEADGEFGGAGVTWVNWGQIGRMIRTFRQHGVSHLVIVGSVRRPDLARVRPDLGLVASIPRILKIMASGGDDGVLRNVIHFFEGHGFAVLGPADVAPQLVVPGGALGALAPETRDERDIALGLDIVGRLGPFDVGQCVAVAGGRVIAIEGAEGTDRMLARIAMSRGAAPEDRDGVLVKRPKPGQEMRVDMPTIGPETASRVADAGLRGIAVLAGHVLATQRRELVRRADDARCFVAGVTPSDAQTAAAAFPGLDGDLGLTSGDRADLLLGARVLHSLRPLVECRGVVVARNYVLAIESGEGVAALLERVAGLRQWGSWRLKRRTGVALVDDTIDEATLDRAAASGLRGLAILGTAGGAALPFGLAAQARRRGLIFHGVAWRAVGAAS